MSITAAPQISVTVWQEAAAQDDALCRAFALRFGARLAHTGRGQRVAWVRQDRPGYGLLLPDALAGGQPDADDWYIYYVWGESLFRRSRAERERMEMLILAESVDDWAELLRQALNEETSDVSYRVMPNFIDALGDVQAAASGWLFTLEACAPPAAVCAAPLELTGTGDTPAAAARDTCRRWLDEEHG